MTTPELPPLPPLGRFSQDFDRMRVMQDGAWCPYDDVKAIDDAREARERILLARIAELQDEADRRTREVEADAERYRWLRTATYLGGETLAVFVIDEASEIANKGEWLSDEQLDAAIDAAREAKP